MKTIRTIILFLAMIRLLKQLLWCRCHVWTGIFLYFDSKKKILIFSENTMIAFTANYLITHWKDKKVVPLVITDNESDMKAIGNDYRYVTTLLNYVKGLQILLNLI